MNSEIIKPTNMFEQTNQICCAFTNNAPTMGAPMAKNAMRKIENPMTTYGVRMPPATWRIIRKMATDRQMSPGAIIREIVSERIEPKN
jgi:predicted DNA-binding ribbon-helix-helix protein